MASAPKPTLHEIAAMPFPASQNAMRKHYDAKWHLEVTEREGPRKFRVRADWTVFGTMDEIIEAEDEDEAREKAREYAIDDFYSGEVEIDFRKVEEVSE